MIKHLTLGLLATGFILAVTPVTAVAEQFRGGQLQPNQAGPAPIFLNENPGVRPLDDKGTQAPKLSDFKNKNRMPLPPPQNFLPRNPPRQIDPGPALPEHKKFDTGPQTQPPGPEVLKRPEPKSGPATGNLSGGRPAISHEFSSAH